MSTTRRMLSGKVGLVVLAVVTAAVISGTMALGQGDERMRPVSYASTAGPVVNPERGWYDAVNVVRDRDFTEQQEAGVSLVFSYVRLDDYRTDKIPKRLLNHLGYGLGAIRDSGMKVILRFTYNFGPAGPQAQDAPLEWILRHIEQLGPVLQKHADVIAGVQAGFIGTWGEWHNSTNGLDTDPAAKRAIVAAERAAFPGQLMLRYPSDVRLLSADSTDTTVGGTAVDDSIGIHQDCFLASEPDDRGTWGRDGSSVADDKALAAEVGRYAIAGGETCGVSERTTCDVALREMEQMHFTFLNAKYEPASLAELADCRDEITERLGYRLELNEASWPGSLSHGARTLPLRLAIDNTGFASPYAERPAYAVLQCGRDVQRVELDSDPRTWDPGTTEIDEDLAIRAPGDAVNICKVGVALPDASEGLAGDADYAIRFASSTQWRGGVNWLGTVRLLD